MAKHAYANGMKIFGWYEYGLVSAYTPWANPFDIKIKELGWYIGSYRNFNWMHPEKSTVFLANMMAYAVEKYSLDGV